MESVAVREAMELKAARLPRDPYPIPAMILSVLAPRGPDTLVKVWQALSEPADSPDPKVVFAEGGEWAYDITGLPSKTLERRLGWFPEPDDLDAHWPLEKEPYPPAHAESVYEEVHHLYVANYDRTFFQKDSLSLMIRVYGMAGSWTSKGTGKSFYPAEKYGASIVEYFRVADVDRYMSAMMALSPINLCITHYSFFPNGFRLEGSPLSRDACTVGYASRHEDWSGLLGNLVSGRIHSMNSRAATDIIRQSSLKGEERLVGILNAHRLDDLSFAALYGAALEHSRGPLLAALEPRRGYSFSPRLGVKGNEPNLVAFSRLASRELADTRYLGALRVFLGRIGLEELRDVARDLMCHDIGSSHTHLRLPEEISTGAAAAMGVLLELVGTVPRCSPFCDPRSLELALRAPAAFKLVVDQPLGRYARSLDHILVARAIACAIAAGVPEGLCLGRVGAWTRDERSWYPCIADALYPKDEAAQIRTIATLLAAAKD